MKTLLWLDDIRDPKEETWREYYPIKPDIIIWVKSYKEFTEWITQKGLPTAICFDHDLGIPITIEARQSKGTSKKEARKLKQQEKTGKDCANWLIEYCLDHSIDIPLYTIQSANPVGKDNIDSLLKNYNKMYNNR